MNAAPAKDEFPVFGAARTALDHRALKYNPCNDIIFPSVIATERLAAPLGRYYMYYAPHNRPGGICLAYADALEGPWTEHAANPVIATVWEPHYNVGHVSSPHAFWMAAEGRLFLYFHGDNRFTRLATSADGISFRYEGEMVEASSFDGARTASYARVFEHPRPTPEARYVMLLMGHTVPAARIYIAFSADARRWRCRREVFIDLPPGTGVENVCSPWYLPWRGRHYVLYHGDLPGFQTNVYATEVGADFTLNRFAGLFYDRRAAGPDNLRVADPCVIEEGGRLRLFISTGPRLSQDIAVATAQA